MNVIRFFLIPLLGMLLLAGPAWSQKKAKPSLEIILSDHAPLQISINGRLYQKVNQKLVIRDLPARNNNIEVIRKCNRKENPNCKDEIVFSGKVKMERNRNYQAVVLVNEGKMMVSDQGDLIPGRAPDAPETSVQNQEGSTEFQKIADIKSSLSSDLQALGERMKKINKDADRVNAASNFVKNRSVPITTDEAIAISSWIMYDEHKLQFLKNVYPSVSDRDQFHQAHIVFTMVSFRDEFNTFLSSQE